MNKQVSLIEILTHHIAIQREKNSPLAMDLQRVKEALSEKDESLISARTFIMLMESPKMTDCETIAFRTLTNSLKKALSL